MLRLGVGVGCVGGRYSSRNRPKKEKQKTKVYMSLCSVETNQNLIYKGAQTEERSLLEERRGKKVVESWVESRNDDCCPLPYTVRTACFLITGATYASFVFLLLTIDATGNARSPSGTAICDSLTLTHYTHSLTHIYVDIYISLSPSAEAGALAAMQESAQPV